MMRRVVHDVVVHRVMMLRVVHDMVVMRNMVVHVAHMPMMAVMPHDVPVRYRLNHRRWRRRLGHRRRARRGSRRRRRGLRGAGSEQRKSGDNDKRLEGSEHGNLS